MNPQSVENYETHARLHEGGYDLDALLREQDRQNNAYWDTCGHPLVLCLDPGPQQVNQYTSLRGPAAGSPIAPVVSLSWETLPCMPYEHGRGICDNVVCFDRRGGSGVFLGDLLGSHSLPELVNGDGAGLPDDVAAKISIRIEFPGCEPYTRQIMSRRSTSTGETISLITLARKIAEEMAKFMEVTTKAHKPLMHDGIVLEMKDLLLCRLYESASGSWVPEFKVPHWSPQA